MRALSIFILTILFINVSFTQPPPLYLDPAQPVEARVEDLLARMSLDEKIGQMTLVEKNSITPQDVTAYFIGGLLSGGGGYPTPNTPQAWHEMVSAFQDGALAAPLAIPLIYGVDAVHGHNNVRGAVIFPHNIGLGAAGDAALVERIGRITALEMLATGIPWNYAPVLAVPQDIRWGRTYEGYSEDVSLVTVLSAAFLRGLQGEALNHPESALGTPKHFVGDGGAAWGTSPFGEQNIDRGATLVDESGLRFTHMNPYLAALQEGARSIMASFTSWDGIPMHAHTYLLTDVLKGELGFDGFIVSDWQAIDLIDPDYDTAVIRAINAGIDMNMVPYDYRKFIATLKRAVENGDVPLARIDDAVRRILRVKFEIGLFERPYGNPELLARVGSEEHRAVAREAVQKSLVLLKNADNTLPIPADTTTIFIAGEAADDIGLQSGGWTIEWQGAVDNITEGTTLRAGIEAAVSPDTRVMFNRHGRFDRFLDESGAPIIADYGIVVVGEQPYTEWYGDTAEPALSPTDLAVIERVRERVDKLIIILISGRPLVITDTLNESDAFVAAWLPGSEGQGVADVLFGSVPFTGTLPFRWPRTLAQIESGYAAGDADCDQPLFPLGYGLTFENSDSAELILAKECP